MRSKFWRRLTRATLHHADNVDRLLGQVSSAKQVFVHAAFLRKAFRLPA